MRLISLDRCTIAATFLLCTAWPAQSQPSDAQQQWSVITLTQIKPEFRQEYEAFQKDVTAAYKKAGIPSRAVLQTVLGNVSEYVSVYPLAKFAEMDGPSVVERALGKEGSAKLLRRGSAYITGMHRMTSRSLPDLSIETPMKEPAQYALVVTLRVRPGKADDYAALIKDQYLPALKKSGVANFWVSQDLFGGDPNERVTVRMLKTLSELDGGPVTTKTMGAEWAKKYSQDLSAVAQTLHYTVVRYRADLSYMPAPPPTSTK
jgi:hypothetical protein